MNYNLDSYRNKIRDFFMNTPVFSNEEYHKKLYPYYEAFIELDIDDLFKYYCEDPIQFEAEELTDIETGDIPEYAVLTKDGFITELNRDPVDNVIGIFEDLEVACIYAALNPNIRSIDINHNMSHTYNLNKYKTLFTECRKIFDNYSHGNLTEIKKQLKRLLNNVLHTNSVLEHENIKKTSSSKKKLVKESDGLTACLKYTDKNFPSDEDDYKMYYISFEEEIGKWEPWQRMNEYAFELYTNAPVLAKDKSDVEQDLECTAYYDENGDEHRDPLISKSFDNAMRCALDGFGAEFPVIDFIELKVGETY